MSLEAFQERIRHAAARSAPLRLRGGGTKDFYGEVIAGDVVDVRSIAGIVAYAPGELVMTAMPSVHIVEHAVCSFAIFSILTMQTRQEPSTPNPG